MNAVQVSEAVLPVREKTDGRNYGIDLLRLVAMFYVVILHSLGQGGVLGGEGVNRLLSYGMETWAYCAVDCFALISGYVAFRQDKAARYRFSGYMNLYLQVVFYVLLVSGYYWVRGSEHVDRTMLLHSFRPVYYGEYWYFTAYTGLFFLMPVINAGVQRTDRKLAGKIAVMIFIFVVWVTACALNGDRFFIGGGYSMVWLVILYTLGAVLKKSELLSAIPLWPMWLMNLVLIAVTAYQASQEKIILMSYTSFAVVFNALCHIALFSRLKLSGWAEKLVKFGAPGAFAVYLLNTHPVFWLEFMDCRFQYLQSRSPLALFLTITAFSLLFVICSVLIDAVRQRLFGAVGIPKLTKWADSKLNAALDRILSVVGA